MVSPTVFDRRNAILCAVSGPIPSSLRSKDFTELFQTRLLQMQMIVFCPASLGPKECLKSREERFVFSDCKLVSNEKLLSLLHRASISSLDILFTVHWFFNALKKVDVFSASASFSVACH